MALPQAQRQNVLNSVHADLFLKIEEEGLAPQRAYIELCLDYQGFSKDSEWRTDHVSDGPKDYGIDCWDISDNSITVLQFKSTDFQNFIDDSVKTSPDGISDIARIISILSSDDKIPTDMNKKSRCSCQNFIH